MHNTITIIHRMPITMMLKVSKWNAKEYMSFLDLGRQEIMS